MVAPISCEILRIHISIWCPWGGWFLLLSCKSAELKMYHVPGCFFFKFYLLLFSQFLMEFLEAEDVIRTHKAAALFSHYIRGGNELFLTRYFVLNYIFWNS